MDNRIARAHQVISHEILGLKRLYDHLDDGFVKAVDLIDQCAGSIIVTGIGKSGIIAQKIVATLNAIGQRAAFLHPVEALHGDLGLVDDQDAVLALSYSGLTAETTRVCKLLKEWHLPLIAMTSQPRSTLARLADATINVAIPVEACPLGLSPTTSSTAMLVMGDALALSLAVTERLSIDWVTRVHPAGTILDKLPLDNHEEQL